jgi:putative CocE/NonD family hydrolase
MEPETTDIVIERNVTVPMRDGVNLVADIFRPAGAGPWPVLVTRIPYNKDMPFGDDPVRRIFLELNLDSLRMVRAGYVIVAQDTRGRFASEGEFTPFDNEWNDGVDTIEWATRQAWSTGKVGMYGVSYQGLTQWQAAAGNPSALAAIAPAQSFMHWHPYRGGAFMLSVAAGWTTTQGLPGELERQVALGRATNEELEEVRRAEDDLKSIYSHLPGLDVPLFAGRVPYYADWLSHPTHDAYWQNKGPQNAFEQITVPALILAGWYDYFLAEDLKNYTSMRDRSGSEQSRRSTRLIIGPWSHGNFWAFYPDRDYASVAGQAAIDLTGTQIEWFDHWLKESDNNAEAGKPVRLYVMGTNVWRDEEDWPLPDTRYTPYYLHNNPAVGFGAVSTEATGAESHATFMYDPHDPVPSLSPATFADGPFADLADQRPVEDRSDVICYTSPPMEQPLEVTGPIQLVLYASSSALDTDFTGKLVDVSPDGHADLLTDGILRARYHRSLSDPELLEPGRIYEFRIDIGATANVFLPGHRIRLEVSSSNFPRFDRNTNTGGAIASETEADFVVATNSVYSGSAYPSQLILPIIERD